MISYKLEISVVGTPLEVARELEKLAEYFKYLPDDEICNINTSDFDSLEVQSLNKI